MSGRARPRGFAPYRPQDDAVALIDTTRALLDDYREHLPLTLRQVLYRLVSTENVGKTERDYKRLCEVLGRARRARLLPMSAFRDDGFRHGHPPGWSGTAPCSTRYAQRSTASRSIGRPDRTCA